MRRTLVIAVLVLTVASIALAGQKQSAGRGQRRSVEGAIRQLDHERIQAQIGANAVALNRIYADDFIGVGPSGTVRTKAQVISDFTSGDLKFQSITTDDVQVRVYGNTAVETGRSTMNGQDKGQTVPHDTRFTRVWVMIHKSLKDSTARSVIAFLSIRWTRVPMYRDSVFRIIIGPAMLD